MKNENVKLKCSVVQKAKMSFFYKGYLENKSYPQVDV